MENEIKVNEYIRTDTGKIDKVINVDYYMPQYIECEKDLIFKNNIVKHSPKLIDIVKTGDYVNGRLVLQVDYKNQNICLLIPLTDTKANTNIMWYGYEYIKTIVTKEQFKSISYKVKE